MAVAVQREGKCPRNVWDELGIMGMDEQGKRAGSLRPSASLVKGDGQPSDVYMRDSGFYCASPFMGPC